MPTTGKTLGQRIVIENRSGVGGNIGSEAVVKSEPDGYTLGQIQLGNVAINPYVYTDMTFDPLTDLIPVAPLTSSPILVVANAKLPANNLKELIELAKREPGTLSYGSAGPAPCRIWRASCSSRSPASTSCMCPTAARGRR